MPVLNIAHRGGAALRPENTLTAFGTGFARGADGAELDVQLSADGIVVIHHDFRLNPGYARWRGGNWVESPSPRIKDLTLAELWEYDIGMPRPGSDYARAHPLLEPANGEGIPTLEKLVEIVKIYNEPYRLLVELKCDASADSPDPVALADAALAVVEEADFLDRAIFVGFDWRALRRVKERQPRAEIWCTSDENIEGDEILFETIRAIGGVGWFPYFARLTPEAAVLARSFGLALAAWTVNDEDNMRRLMALGINAICTDRPDTLKALEAV